MIQEWIDAWQHSNELPRGVSRAEYLANALKSIDTSHTPIRFQLAVSNYISALDNGIEELKAGRNSGAQSEQIATNRELILKIFEEYR